jgi:hypothetical protein
MPIPPSADVDAVVALRTDDHHLFRRHVEVRHIRRHIHRHGADTEAAAYQDGPAAAEPQIQSVRVSGRHNAVVLGLSAVNRAPVSDSLPLLLTATTRPPRASLASAAALPPAAAGRFHKSRPGRTRSHHTRIAQQPRCWRHDDTAAWRRALRCRRRAESKALNVEQRRIRSSAVAKCATRRRLPSRSPAVGQRPLQVVVPEPERFIPVSILR